MWPGRYPNRLHHYRLNVQKFDDRKFSSAQHNNILQVLRQGTRQYASKGKKRMVTIDRSKIQVQRYTLKTHWRLRGYWSIPGHVFPDLFCENSAGSLRAVWKTPGRFCIVATFVQHGLGKEALPFLLPETIPS